MPTSSSVSNSGLKDCIKTICNEKANRGPMLNALYGMMVKHEAMIRPISIEFPFGWTFSTSSRSVSISDTDRKAIYGDWDKHDPDMKLFLCYRFIFISNLYTVNRKLGDFKNDNKFVGEEAYDLKLAALVKLYYGLKAIYSPQQAAECPVIRYMNTAKTENRRISRYFTAESKVRIERNKRNRFYKDEKLFVQRIYSVKVGSKYLSEDRNPKTPSRTRVTSSASVRPEMKVDPSQTKAVQLANDLFGTLSQKMDNFQVKYNEIPFTPEGEKLGTLIGNHLTMAIMYLRPSLGVPSDTARSVLRQTFESLLAVGQSDAVKNQAVETKENKTEEKKVKKAKKTPKKKTDESAVIPTEVSPIPNNDEEFEIDIGGGEVTPDPKRRRLRFDTDDEFPTKVNIKSITPGLAEALNRPGPVTITETLASMGMVSGASDGDSVEDSRGDTSAESDDQPAQALSFLEELVTSGSLPGHGILRMRGPDFSDSPPSAKDKRLGTFFSRGMDEGDDDEECTFGLSKGQYEKAVKRQKFVNLMQASADNYNSRGRADMTAAFKAVKLFYSYLPGPHSTRADLSGAEQHLIDLWKDHKESLKISFYLSHAVANCLLDYRGLERGWGDQFMAVVKNALTEELKSITAYARQHKGPFNLFSLDIAIYHRALLCGSVDMGRGMEINVDRCSKFPFYTGVLEGDCNFLGSDEENDELTVISSRTNSNPPDRSARQVNRLNLRRTNERERKETVNMLEEETETEVREDEVEETVYELKNTPIPALFDHMKEYNSSISEEGDSECEELEID